MKGPFAPSAFIDLLSFRVRWVSCVKKLHAIVSKPFSSTDGPTSPSYIFLPPSSYSSLLPYLEFWLKPPVGTIKFTRLMKHVGGMERTKQLQEMHASGALGPKYSGMPDPFFMQRREAEEKVDALISGHGSGAGIKPTAAMKRAAAAAPAASSAARKKFKDMALKEKEQNERDMRTVLTKLIGYSEDEVLKMPFTKLKQKVKDSREDIVELLVAMKTERSVMYGVNGSMLREGEWVAAGSSVTGSQPSGAASMGLPSTATGGGGVSAHVPPRELREKYHGKQFDLWMERVAKDEREFAANSERLQQAATPMPTKKAAGRRKNTSAATPSSSQWYTAKNDWDKGRLTQSAKAIRQTWKANMSLDDGKHGTLDQELDLDLFKNIHYFAEFDEIYGLGGGVGSKEGEGYLEGEEGYARKRESPAWAYGAAFFMGVVDAIKELTRGVDGEDEVKSEMSQRGRLRIEFVADGIHEFLAKIRAGVEDARPANFPKKWTRIWLSNVP